MIYQAAAKGEGAFGGGFFSYRTCVENRKVF
jgi:hypothetical protein